MAERIYDTATVAAHFSRAAATYDTYAALQHSYLNKAYEWLAHNAPAKTTMLDAGCGTGAFAQLAAANQPDWNIIGCDIAAKMCEISKPHQSATIRADIQQWSIKNEALDAALCAFALQWSNTPQSVIQSLASSLKPNGTLLLYSFSEGTLAELREATRFAGAAHVVSTFHPSETYAKWVENAGLSMVEFSENTHTEYFKNAEALFVHLKKMGASNSLANRSKNLGSRSELKKISEKYSEHFTRQNGIKVTWNVVCAIARK